MHERCSGLGDTTAAMESLIVQLESQDELTMPRRENKKNSTRKQNFKRKRTRLLCVGTSDLSIDTQKICANLVRLSL
jgi:hypothetical protein